LKDDIPLWDEPHVRQRPAPKVLHTILGPPSQFFRPILPSLDSTDTDSVALMVQSLAYTTLMQRREWLYQMVWKAAKMMYAVADNGGETERTSYLDYLQSAADAKADCDAKASVAALTLDGVAQDPLTAGDGDDAINDLRTSLATLEVVLANLISNTPAGAAGINPVDMDEFALCAAGFGGGVGTTTSPPERPIFIVTVIPTPLSIRSVPDFVSSTEDTSLHMRPGNSYTYTLNAVDGTPPYSWNAAPGDDSVATAVVAPTAANGASAKVVIVAVSDGTTDIIISCTDSTPADETGPYMASFTAQVEVTSPPPPPPPPPPDPPPSPPPPP
jgi:hypothetical protein